jgi:H+/Cl- antiporter ClcA
MGNGYVPLSLLGGNLSFSHLTIQVFATVVGSLSAVTALVFMILPILISYTTVAILFAWDFILFILWCAVFGLFGSMYIHAKAEMDSGIQRMKNAVWIDLICLLLWFITSIIGAIGFWKGRNNRTLYTGRAKA